MTEQQQLEAAIAALEGQRSTLGRAAVESLLSAARARLEALEPLDAAPNAPVQTLRQVSILFMDVVGWTALSQQLDPEAISAVLDGALSRATAVVQAHGGKVLQYAGDNLLAVFGAAEAREDDAQQAVRCGLALLELGKLLGADVHAAHGHAGFDVRAGVHTGVVLLGGGVDADSSIRGIAVNIAARMEQTAPAGALRISHDAHAQVRGLFEVERPLSPSPTFSAVWPKVKFQGRPDVRLENRRRLLWVGDVSSSDRTADVPRSSAVDRDGTSVSDRFREWARSSGWRPMTAVLSNRLLAS